MIGWRADLRTGSVLLLRASACRWLRTADLLVMSVSSEVLVQPQDALILNATADDATTLIPDTRKQLRDSRKLPRFGQRANCRWVMSGKIEVMELVTSSTP